MTTHNKTAGGDAAQPGHVATNSDIWRYIVFDAIEEPVFLHDAQFRVLLANRAYCTAAGMTEEEVLGKPYWEVFPRGAGPFPSCKDATSGKDNINSRDEVNAGEKLFLSTGYTVRDDQGNVLYALHILSDITAQRQSEAELRKSNDFLQSIVENVPVRIFWKDRDSRYLGCNTQFAKEAGRSRPDELTGKTDFEMGWKDQAESYRADDKVVMESGNPKLNYEEQQTAPDGNTIWLGTSKVPLRDESNRVIGILGIYQDITERKQAEANLRIAANAFEAQEGMMVTDANSMILRVNNAFTDITGYTAEEVIGKNPRILSSGRQDASFYAAMWESINNTGVWEGKIQNRRKNGEIYPEYLSIAAVKDPNGTVINYVATFTDNTMSSESAEKIKNLAFYDTLTGLPNRRLFKDRLQHAFDSSGRSGREGALLYIDLDNFRDINDTLGHDIGDLLLQQAALRLKSCMRKGDTVARLGGDEFIVMLEDLSEQPVKAVTETKALGEIIFAALNKPYQLATHEYHSTVSIGAAIFSDHSESGEELLKRADIAMCQAKQAGRNTMRFFNPKMQDIINTRTTLASELHKAIENRQFQLYYQIQVDSSHRPLGAEALIRWLHPERGLVFPAEFIPLAEENGLILPIGQWVLETACNQLKAWELDALTRDFVLSVNVSARQFRQADFVAQIQSLVQRHAFNPKLLKLELTESILLENIKDTIALMNALKAIGVGFSLDDFGTGYSSLQYLKRLPLDQLKIDQSFVRDLAVNSSDKTIVRTIIAMAQSLEMDVIAEGVETEEQRQFLLDSGCTRYQGYLFGEPVPIEQFEASLKQG